MMRNLDKLVLLGGGALLALVLLLEVGSVANLNGEFSRTRDDARKLAEKVNNNNLPPKTQNPKDFSGRVFAAWEMPPINATPFSAADFYPNSPR